MTGIERNLVELLKDLILIPSTASNAEGLFQVVSFLAQQLSRLEGVRVDAHRSNGRPSLVARAAAAETIDVFLVGHVDVVDAPPEAFYPRIEGNRLYGRGAGDMKGQVAVLVEVFKTMVNRAPDVPLGLMITADEESGGLDGVGYLVNEKEYTCSLAVIPDSGALNEIVEREKGILGGRIVSHGTSGHSARPWLSDNAVHRLLRNVARVLEHFRSFEDRPAKWYPTISANMLRTRNTTYNSVPESAEAFVDIRFTERETAAGMIALIGKLLDERTEFFPEVIAEPLVTEPDALFLRVTAEVTGKPVDIVRGHGGSDGRFFTRRGIPVIMSRPNVGGLHSDNEWIEIDSMLTYFRILETYLSARFGQSVSRPPLASGDGWAD